MDRRHFLGYSALGSATLLTGPIGCAPAHAPEDSAMTRQTGNEPFELHEATVAELQEGMESGQRTARAITEMYLARIEALNRRGPELRAIIETNPDALSLADELDRERRENG